MLIVLQRFYTSFRYYILPEVLHFVLELKDGEVEKRKRAVLNLLGRVITDPAIYRSATLLPNRDEADCVSVRMVRFGPGEGELLTVKEFSSGGLRQNCIKNLL